MRIRESVTRISLLNPRVRSLIDEGYLVWKQTLIHSDNLIKTQSIELGGVKILRTKIRAWESWEVIDITGIGVTWN